MTTAPPQRTSAISRSSAMRERRGSPTCRSIASPRRFSPRPRSGPPSTNCRMPRLRRWNASRSIVRATKRSPRPAESRRWRSALRPRLPQWRRCSQRSRNSITRWATNRRRALIRCVRRPGRRGDRQGWHPTTPLHRNQGPTWHPHRPSYRPFWPEERGTESCAGTL